MPQVFAQAVLSALLLCAVSVASWLRSGEVQLMSVIACAGTSSLIPSTQQ